MDIKLVNDTISTIMEYLHGEILDDQASRHLERLGVPHEVIEHIEDTIFNYTLQYDYSLWGIIPEFNKLAENDAINALGKRILSQ